MQIFVSAHFVDNSEESRSHYLLLSHDLAVWKDHVCVNVTASTYNVIDVFSMSSCIATSRLVHKSG